MKQNQKFGKWTVLEFDCVDSKRRRRYLCRCECGVEKSVIASYLANGRTKSCPRCKRDDLVGKKYGFWTVIEKSDEKSSSSGYKTQWLCECSNCGQQSLVERCNLVTGKSKGCWHCRRDVQSTFHFPNTWYRRLLDQAKLRGHEFTVTEEELFEVWEKQNRQCAITGLPLEITKSNKTNTGSLDRIDNSLGYTKDNVWFLHKHVNMMKYKYDLDYFVKLCRLVVENAT